MSGSFCTQALQDEYSEPGFSSLSMYTCSTDEEWRA
jgi:hypothetical protein